MKTTTSKRKDLATQTAIAEALTRAIKGLRVTKYFDNGSTARVYQVEHPIGNLQHVTVTRIVKVYRTKTTDPGLSEYIDPEELFAREVAALAAVSHTNVIRLYDAGTLNVPGFGKLVYYIMEYVPAARDINVWVASHIKTLTGQELLSLLRQVCSGLEALHAADILHCDLKPGNVIVGQGHVVKVADLGFSKFYRRPASNDASSTDVHTDLAGLPNKYHAYLAKVDRPERGLLKLPRGKLDVPFDLHKLAVTFEEVLRVAGVEAKFATVEMRGIRDVLERMKIDSRSQLPAFNNIAAASASLARVGRDFVTRAGVQELSGYTGTKTIRIPICGSIPFSRRVGDVVSHPHFQRMHNALQLGFTYLVFPGARHTRFEHSLGVYSSSLNYINALLSDDCLPYFRETVDAEMISTTAVAGLLHDIGQTSFAHHLEDVGLSFRHEQASADIIRGNNTARYLNDRYEADDTLGDRLHKRWPEVNLERLIWLIAGKPEDKPGASFGWEVCRQILSGPLDADKTDYLVRDSYHAGVEYARSIDMARFMNSLTAGYAERRNYKGTEMHPALAFTWKGARPAENIVLSRMQLFWVLYWHHAVRAAHAMFACAVSAHKQSIPKAEYAEFQRALYCDAVSEILSKLSGSASLDASRLANMLRKREIFKRAVEFEYGRDDMYDVLLAKKEECLKAGDYMMTTLSAKLAEAWNRKLSLRGGGKRIAPGDVIVDVPVEGKDKLGVMYYVRKGSETAQEFESEMLKGGADDWQKRVKTARVFVHPKHMEVVGRRYREIAEGVGEVLAG